MSINRYSKEEKVMQPIIPPEELDIQRFMESPNDHEPSRYALAAQIIHRGDSKHSGILFIVRLLSNPITFPT